MFETQSYCFIFFVCTESPTINASRIAKRVMEGGHDVPISKVISRYKNSILNCCIASNIADRTYIYDNSAENKTAKILFRLTEGELTKQYVENVPEWAPDTVWAKIESPGNTTPGHPGKQQNNLNSGGVVVMSHHGLPIMLTRQSIRISCYSRTYYRAYDTW